MKKVMMVNTIKIGCYGKDLRSKGMKNLKMILDDNKLIYTYNRVNKMFYVLIDSLTTYKAVENIYNNFMVEYDKEFMEVYVPADTKEDGHYIIGQEDKKEGNEIEMNLQLLARKSDTEQAKLVETLIKCELVEDIESISINGDYIETDLGEFLIFDNYTDAEAEAVEQCKQIMEDCGLTETLIFEAEIQGLIDTQWFIDYWQELHEFNAYEEGIQYIATDEEMEQLENGEITEEEIRDNYFNMLQDSIKGQEIEEYKFQFGEGYFNDILIREGLIDIEALSQWCVDIDGVAHFLASYDGEEIEENGYYIYRIN